MNKRESKAVDAWPNFFLIGAAKCGTTSLHHSLSQHPQIFLPREKETHFFDNSELYQQGTQFYISHYFSGAQLYSARGEATPAYLHWPDVVIPRMQATFGERPLKFVVMLRDPVERAWSHYLHMVRNGAEPLPFAAALEAEEARMRATPDQWFGYYRDGLYAAQLALWFQAFPQVNFRIYTLGELIAKPKTTLDDLFTFLDVAPEFVPDLTRQNEASEIRSPLFIKLTQLNLPGRHLLKRSVPPHLRRRVHVGLRSLNSRPIKHKEQIDPVVAAELRNRYQADITALERMLDRQFSAWKPAP